MPQFDTTFFFSQIVWLLISFGGLYLGIRFVVFPMFCRIFQARSKQIQEPLEQAEHLIFETQLLQSKLEQKELKERFQQEEAVHQAYIKAESHMEKQLKESEKKLAQRLKRKVQKLNQESQFIMDQSDKVVRQVVQGGVK